MPASPPSEPTLAELLKALDQLAGTEFHSVELRVGDSRLRVARAPAAPVAAAPVGLPVGQPVAAVVPGSATGADEGAADPAPSGLEAITAPMIGTFYRRPRPEAEPFVSVGDRVRKGQILCIIEAMKLMNNIEADSSGEVVEIVPDDGSTVQFGDRLFMIRPA